ncbi:MAG: hypothetical protein IPO41_13755 [Acidobacteria bacterium]|nr:hypothetical protein [Acidobacteriota bacterium]
MLTFEDLVAKMGLDEGFRGGAPVKNGYTFKMTVEPYRESKPAFYFGDSADPVSAGVTASGTRHFTDSSLSNIKGTDENRPAKPDDPSI